MPPPTTSSVSRKRTRSTNISESTDNHQQPTSTNLSSSSSAHPNSTAPPKRQRNNPPTTTRPNYSLRNRSITSDSRQTSTRLPSIDRPTTSQRYNLRPRLSQSQVRLPRVSTPHPTTNTTSTTTTSPPPITTTTNVSNRTRRQISTTTNPTQQEQSTLSTVPSRPYRLVYISDDDDHHHAPTTQTSPTIVNTTFSLVTDNNNSEESRRSQISSRRLARSTNNISHNTRSRTITEPTTNDNQDFTNSPVAHVRLDRAIEIVIDSIQSLEGAVNNFDQLFIALIYGRLSTRTEFETIEGMIRLSRILNLNFPSRLTQDEIDALPKIKFLNKTDSSSVLLVEKCPICLTEFNDQEIINKLHCSHLFHLQCIGTWLSENDSCPTCRRKVNGD